jgi:hypothetical protein
MSISLAPASGTIPRGTSDTIHEIRLVLKAVTHRHMILHMTGTPVTLLGVPALGLFFGAGHWQEYIVRNV